MNCSSCCGEFDEQNGWNTGFLSCAHWLSWRTGIDMGAAREKVRVAKALDALPRLSGAMQRGEISYAKVRALTRVATPENEERCSTSPYTANGRPGGARGARMAPLRSAGGGAGGPSIATWRGPSRPMWTTTAWSSCARG